MSENPKPRERTVPYYACKHGVQGGCAFCNATDTPKPRAGEHTAGPWATSDSLKNGDVAIRAPELAGDGKRVIVAECFEDIRRANEKATAECQANARRIVACVNYCEGVSTAEIEAAPKSMNLRAILDAFDSVVAKAVS